MLAHIFRYNVVFVISLLVGLLSNLVIVWVYSLGDAVDAYFSSIMLTTVFSAVFLDFLNKSFMTSIVKVRAENEDAVNGFITTVVTCAALFFSALAAGLVLASPLFIDSLVPGYSSEKQATVLRNMTLTLPAIVFLALASLHECLWQERESYVRVALAGGARPLSMLLCVALFHDVLGVVALPVGFLIGSIIAFLVVVVGAGYRYSPSEFNVTEDVKSVLVRTAFLSGSGFLSRLRPIIEQFFGSSLGGGAVGSLVLASKLVQPIYNGALRAVRLVTFTQGAIAVGQIKNPEDLRSIFQISSSAIALVMLPLCVWMTIHSNAVAALILTSETQDTVLGLGAAIMGLAPSIVIKGVNRNLMGAQYARENVIFVSVLGPSTTALMLIFSLVLVDDYGVLGLALSGTLASAVALIVNVTSLSWATEVINPQKLFGIFLRYFVFASLCTSIAFGTYRLVEGVIVGLSVSLVTMVISYIFLLFASRDSLFFLFLKKIGKKRAKVGT